MITLIPQKMYASNIVAQFDENAVSCNYGLKVKDEILEIDGRKIYTYYDLSYAFTNKDGGKIDILVNRDGKEVELKGVRFATQTDNDITYLTLDFKVYGYKNSFGNFIKQSFKTTLSFGAVVWRSLIDLICGRYGISAISGRRSYGGNEYRRKVRNNEFSAHNCAYNHKSRHFQYVADTGA